MARHRIPVFIRAIALFLASLPVARATAASGMGAQPLAGGPVHEAKAPGAQLHTPFIAVGAVAVAVAAAVSLPEQAPVQRPSARRTGAHVALRVRTQAAHAAGQLIRGRSVQWFELASGGRPGSISAKLGPLHARELGALRPRAP